MSTMIDRAAANILAKVPEGYGMTRLEAREYAIAAIEAMREPTTMMVSEGESLASIGIGKPSDDEALPRVWRGMVDIALNEKAPA